MIVSYIKIKYLYIRYYQILFTAVKNKLTLDSTMRKLLILLILTTLTSAASAQEWSFGPKISPNISKHVGGRNSDYPYFPGVRVGFFIEHNFSRVAIETDILYSLQGNRDWGPCGCMVEGPTIERDGRSHFLTVPILAKVYVTDKKTSGLNIFVGPELDVSLNDQTAAIGDKLNPVTLAVNFGLGYKFGNSLNLSLGYTNGVIPIIKTPNGNEYNSCYNLSVSYNFLRKK